VKASESQGNLVVHDVTLDEGAVAREPFLDQGRGSAFESRPNEVVVVRPTPAGVPAIPEKVRQLVDSGFHSVLVDLLGVDGLEPGGTLPPLQEACEYVNQFVGWLAVCTDGDLGQALEDEEIQVHAGRDAALAAYRQQSADEDEPEPETSPSIEGPLSMGDLLGSGSSSSDTVADGASDSTYAGDLLETGILGADAKPAVEDPNDWGWGSGDSTASPADEEGLPEVQIAELFLSGAELDKLVEEIDTVLARSKRFVNLRLHFDRDRRMQSEDVTALTNARDRLTAAEGQLALVALPQEFLKWLRLLDEDRNFLVVETEDEAELAHRRRAAGKAAAIGSPGAARRSVAVPAAEAAPYTVVEESDRHLVIRPREFLQASMPTPLRTPARLLVLGRGGIPGLAAHLESLAAQEVYDVIVDMSLFREIQGERFDPLPVAVKAAGSAGVRLAFANTSREVKALLKILGIESELLCASVSAAGLVIGAQVNQVAPYEELRLDLAREELLDSPQELLDSGSSLTLDSGDLLSSGEDLAAGPELERLRRELAAAQASAESAREEGSEAQANLARVQADEQRARQQVQELREAVRRDERRILELEQGRRRAEQKAEEEGRGREAARADQQRLSTELANARRELEEARAEAASSQDSVQLVAQLRERTRELEEQVEELEQRPAPLPAGVSGDAGELSQRCAQLEREKAKILTEAEAEIQRMQHEQQVMRDELESAGDMIERLGKELELS
jgi:anti-anti-sigma regulatory factor